MIIYKGTPELEIGTMVRLKVLNFYSTFKELIEFFGLENKCDEPSDLVKKYCPYMLARIHKLWQLTPYIIRNYATVENSQGEILDLYHIESVDGKSNLIVNAKDVEQIKEYNSVWNV